ncbi:DUF6049 family protein [Streptosporangium sp. 'caverna']|uniref:DUF6049 family protein n=1 Tax=Streptosporangium sp. 'caverna' TaxID=2202249 RepID=UPI000D7DA8D7|nr:DUF6049 family protein [Streptosporangium sp. 'caverna']AWS47666.1 hypothetical protein DKM19_46655 [Streptosporangium sp. 'caverna']
MIRKATLLAVLTTTLLLSAAVVLPGAVNAQAAAGRANPQIVLESTGPDVPREPTTQIKISGSLVNTGTQPLDGMRIRMQYSSQPFARRADMEAYQAGTLQPAAWRDERYQQSIAPSGKLPWEFVFTPQMLGISRFGVYPVTIAVFNGLEQQVAAQRTLLTYMPKDLQVPRTKLAMVLPIVDQPHRADDYTFMDENLPAFLAAGKRLGDLLKIAQDTASAKGITWVVDPGLLDDAQKTGRAHTVLSKDTTRRLPADPEAVTWLANLRTALQDHPVVATPYADPDVTALAHNGVDDFTRIAIAQAGSVAKEILGRDVITDVNWPVNGMVDYDGLDLLATGGVDTVLLNVLNLPPVMEPATTPDAFSTVQSVNGPVTAMVADPGLSEALGAVTSTPGAALLGRQRFIAETAMIASEPVTTTRTVIAAPPRRWDPDPAYVSDLVKTAAALPWLSPATLDTAKPGKGVPTPRSGLTYTDQDRRKELGKPYMTVVKRTNARAGLTAAVTTAEDYEGFDQALLRLVSSAWRGRPGTAAPYAERVGATVDDRVGKVTITGTEQSRLRTLAGANGEVPISVHNGLTGTGSRVSVKLKVTPNQRDLLKIEKYKDSEDDLIVIEGGHNRIIRVPMTSTGSGQTTVTVQLTTSDGRKYGKPVELTVRTTGYAGIALFIVGAALVVMLAAVVMRILRRRGGRRAAAARSPRRESAPAGTES